MLKKQEIAAHLDVTPRRLHDILPEIGCTPSDGLDVIRVAYIRRLRAGAAGRAAKHGPLDLVAERARLAKEQADKTAMDNSLRRQELLPADEVQRDLEQVFVAVRGRLLALPRKLAAVVVGAQTPAEAYAALDNGVREALCELAAIGGKRK